MGRNPPNQDRQEMRGPASLVKIANNGTSQPNSMSLLRARKKVKNEGNRKMREADDRVGHDMEGDKFRGPQEAIAVRGKTARCE